MSILGVSSSHALPDLPNVMEARHRLTTTPLSSAVCSTCSTGNENVRPNGIADESASLGFGLGDYARDSALDVRKASTARESAR